MTERNAVAVTTTKGFDYGVLAPEVVDDMKEAAVAIRAGLKRTTEIMFDIGMRLSEVKAALPEGTFLAWLEAETGLQERVAQSMMRTARDLAGAEAKVAALPPTVVQRLAAAPAVVRRELVERAGSGERIRVVDVEQAVKAAKAVAVTTADVTVEAHPPTSPSQPLADDVSADLAGVVRAQLDRLAAAIEALAADVHAAKPWPKSGTATTKKWGGEIYRVAAAIGDTFRGIAGGNYMLAGKQRYPGEVHAGGRTGTLLDVVVTIIRSTESYDGVAVPIAKIDAWRAAFAAAGLPASPAAKPAPRGKKASAG